MLGLDLLSANISLISLSVSFFVAVILFYSPSKFNSSKYLSGVLGIISLIILLRFCVVIKMNLAIYLVIFVFPLLFFIGPLLYFYTRVSLFQKIAHKKELSLYFLPSILTFFIFLLLFYFFPEFLDFKNIQYQLGIVGLTTAIIISLASLYCGYFCFLSLRLIKLYEVELKNQFSSDERGRLVWLKALIVIIILCILTYFTLATIIYIGGFKLPPITPIEGIFQLGLVYLVLFYLIRKPEIISIPYSDTKLIIDEHLSLTQQTAQPKYQKQTLSDLERKNYLIRIQKYMNDEKPFLDEEITLSLLAFKLNIPAHHFSMTINIELSQNFFQFINSYRITTAKLLLSDPGNKNKNVLNIGLDAGFQSKAAFNKAFKMETGKTPTEYRSEILKDSAL
ncbi:MAG: AraC family transcriptional regulator [Leptospira sp.]|nr:AraC family transcriptional regulator [Leptospira sp.]